MIIPAISSKEILNVVIPNIDWKKVYIKIKISGYYLSSKVINLKTESSK